VFLSVVVVARDQCEKLEVILNRISGRVSPLVSDYELIVVDNASRDGSIAELKRLTGEGGLPNLQVYALTKEIDIDTASWVGLENALGDFVVVFDPLADDIDFLPAMLDQAVAGTDVVFASNDKAFPQSILYRLGFFVFNFLYKYSNGIALAQEAPHYRLISKRVVNFILQHPTPSLTYRHLPATGGFSRTKLTYSANPLQQPRAKRVGESIDKGVRLLVSTTQAPMRLVTSLSLFGAVSNLVYSVYVIGIAFFKADVAQGWVTLSLQQSGMFFLISLVLLVLGEYVLHMARLSNEGPSYHVAQEFTSAVMTRCGKLNVEDVRESFKGLDTHA
jgi:hypothetical protein